MLPKQHRLLRADFDLVFKKGRRIRGKSFGLTILSTKSKSEDSKIGVVVSSKVFKNATDRNKIKRQIRGILMKNILPTLSPGKKIVIIAFPGSKIRKYQEMRDELVSLLDNLKS